MPTYNRDEFLAEFDLAEDDITPARERVDAYVQGWNLAQMRQEAGMTQIDVARAMQVTQSRISAIENGEMEAMSLTTLRAYVEALGGTLTLSANLGVHHIDLPLAA